MSRYQFDAYGAYEDLRARYPEFLLDTLGVRTPPLAPMLKRLWDGEEQEEEGSLFAPLLVQGAFPYRPGAPLEALTGVKRTVDKPLHPRTVALLQQAGIDYELFKHQVEAIRGASQGKTVVVAAGTGSGKTEAFLIPIIDRLIRDHEEGKDDLAQPGVRALVVYPLNALVNNQVDRLLGLLGKQREVTFAYYTSRLKEDHAAAKRYYSGRGRRLPPPCQIVDRNTLRGLDGGGDRPKGPPHILVTNFSMLEYMLIRPKDRTIFLEEHLRFQGAPRLKMIVLDEAHVYVGAQAAEMHMLLRRAADRFGTSLEDLQGFATSATLSRSGNDPSTALVDYASRMFAKPASHVAVVEGRTVLPESKLQPRSSASPLAMPEQLPADPIVPVAVRTVEFNAVGRPVALVVDSVGAQALCDAALTLGIASAAEVAALTPQDRERPALVAYRLCSDHPALLALRSWLFEREQAPTLEEVGSRLYGEEGTPTARRRGADAVLRFAALGRTKPDTLPFIPVRMHAFVRAPLGVWVDPRPATDRREPSWQWGKLHVVPTAGEDAPRFPMLVCSTCGAAYLEAEQQGDGTFVPASERGGTHALFAREGAQNRMPQHHGGRQFEAVAISERARFGNRVVMACAHCLAPKARLRSLRLSARLALSAMIDTIYPHLGEMPGETAQLPAGGRRLMTFSDSRQEAARVAAQVEQSHDVGVNRAMLWRAIERQGGPILVRDLIGDLEGDPLARQRAAAEHLRDAVGKEDLAQFSVFEEFGRPPASALNTLETLGLVEVVYPNLPGKPEGLGSMTEAEWHAFLATVLDLTRSSGCVRKPKFESEAAVDLGLDELLPYLGRSLILAAKTAEEIDEEDEAAEEGVKEPTVALIARVGKDAKSEKDATDEAPRNRTTRYAIAVGERVGISWEVLLTATFKALQTKSLAGCKWLREGTAEDSIQIVLSGLELRTHESPPLIAGACGALHFRAVRGAVPGFVGGSEARPLTDAERERWRSRHAVKRVLDDEVLGLWAIEHTAQIDVDSLEDLEGEFRRGGRNLLASSTTMEMGVDIGGLTLVMLTNVPPGPANYWQRAGRAGRRADGTSMTLTLALPTAHDQLVFSDARRFLYSAITPPRIRLDAEPLLVRHVNAFLLAQFFQAAVETRHLGNPMKAFGTVEEFVFDAAADGVRPEVASALGLAPQDPLWIGFRRWLESIDAESPLAQRVRVLCRGTVLAADSLPQLAARAADALAGAVEDVQRDAQIIDQQRTEEDDRGAGVRDEAYMRALDYQRRALVRETLISYFAGKGFLPRFGFPLDVVRLNTKWKLPNREGARVDDVTPDLRMERSLDLALAEYVPGNEIIAGKRVFRSAGIERNWFTKQNALDRHFYFECVKCKHLEDGHAQHARCPVCGHDTISELEFLQWKEEEQKQRSREGRRRRAGRETPEVLDAALLPPSVVRSYLRPSGFAVKLGRKPRRVAGDLNRVGPALSRLSLETDATRTVLANGAVAVAYCPDSRLFVRAEGRPEGRGTGGFGFVVCRVCGLSEAETGWSARLPPGFLGHRALRGFKKCAGTESGMFWRHAVLGTTMPVDAVRLELTAELAPKLADSTLVEPFYRTLAAILQLVAARRLQVDLRALSSGTATRALGDGSFTFNAVVYETATSGLLADVVSQPASLLADLRTLLESGSEADFVRFDTQFLGAQLRPDLVRSHFADPERQKLLDVKVGDGERILRGASPVTWGIELLQDPAQDLLLVAPRFAPGAFDAHGLFPYVRHRAADPAAAGIPVRLLLAETPSPGGSEADALVAARLRQLADTGVQIRRAPALNTALASSRWHMAARKGEQHVALGGVWLPGATQKPELRFGPHWFAEGTPIEADAVTAKDGWAVLSAWWADAKEVTAKDFERPNNEGPQVVLVPPNLAGKPYCVPAALLNRHFQPEGGLSGLGHVSKLVYSDRYVGYSAVSLYYLRDLLLAFDFTPEACVLVRSHGGDPRGKASDPSKVFVLNYVPPALDHATSSAVCEKIGKNVSEKAAVEFKNASDLPHPRKLMVQFAPGGRLKSLVVRFDQGLSWARFSTSKMQKWPEAQAVSKETHVVIWRDKPLAGEPGWF